MLMHVVLRGVARYLKVDLISAERQVLWQRLHAVKVEPLEDGVELSRHRLHNLQSTAESA